MTAEQDTARIVVMVTREHIDTGRRLHPTHCPVARAIQAQVRVPVSVRRYGTDGEWIVYTWGYSDQARVLPGAVGAFIGQFDVTGRGKPLTFSLDIPAWWV